MHINWNVIAAWAFGFFAPAITAFVVWAAGGLLYLWWNTPNRFHLSTAEAWCGGWLFVAVAIILGILSFKLI